MLPIISQSRQAVLKGAFSQTRHTSVLASVIFYPAFLIHSLLSPCICFSFLFSYTASFNSNSPGLPSMMDNPEQLEKKIQKSFQQSFLVCVYVRVYKCAILTESKLFFCQYLELCYLLLSLCRWLAKSPNHFIKYYVFTRGALFCLCAFDVRAAPAGIKAH